MYNRTLNRPMFRRGGRAGGGIMTGVDRQGYQGTDDVADQRVKKLDTETAFLQKAIGERPEIKPYPYKGSDFFMGLGANILSAPGGNPILQTIGQSSRGPLEVMMKQNIADYGNKQKSELGKYQDRRDLIMATYKNLSEEDKDALINRAEQMVKAGRFETIEEALQVLVPTYRKDASPQEIERKEKLDQEKLTIGRVDDLVKIYEIGRPDAVILDGFFNDIESGKFEVPHDPEQYFIEDSDVGRGTTDAEKRLVIRDYDPEQSEYKEGRVYIDFITKKAFVKQGQYLIPYEDYISETISTD
jgi:hypothetical protein